MRINFFSASANWLGFLFVQALLVCVLSSASQAQFNNSGFLQNWYEQATYGQNNTNAAANPPSTAVAPSLVNPTSTGRTLRLGVYVKDYDVGALVTGVEPSSPAAKAGIEVNDLIVTINGAQVGFTPAGYVDVGVQASNAAVNGRVTALVADRRSGELKNVIINLESASNVIRGTVRLADNARLQNASLRISVRDRTRPYAQLNGGNLQTQIQGPGPYAFEMMIDPSSVYANDQYEIVADIVDPYTNRLLYQTTQPVNVNPLANNSPILLTLQNYSTIVQNNNPNNQVVQAGYPNYESLVEQEYLKIMGRSPRVNEQFAWAEFLSKGYSLQEMRATLVSSQQFYDLSGNNPSLFVNNMILKLTGINPTSTQVQQWTQRFSQLGGSQQALVREFINTYNNGALK